MRDDGPARRVTAEGLCGRFEASLRAGAEGVIATDGDGTLWRGDIGDALFDTFVDGGRLREDARDALAGLAEEAGLTSDGDANQLGRALRDAYRAGRLDEGRYFALQAWSYAGFGVDELGAACSEVLDAFGFDGAVRPAMRRILAWCRTRDVPVYLVSASPWRLVVEAARRLELEESRVVAMEPLVRDGRVLPVLASVPTYGPGKVARLAALLGDAPLLAAFGDSAWDAAMLERAAYPVMVAPKPALFSELSGFDGVFVLEDA
jgi:phosphatidylglycerophosphatase C